MNSKANLSDNLDYVDILPQLFSFSWVTKKYSIKFQTSPFLKFCLSHWEWQYLIYTQ